jgi:transporter family-2 protein
VVLGGQQGGDVALEDEVGLDPALDRLLDLGLRLVDQRADAVADGLLPVGESIDVGVDAGVGLEIGHARRSKPGSQLRHRTRARAAPAGAAGSVPRMDRGTAVALTIAVGAGFAMQAPINSALGRDIGALPAAAVSFVVGTITLTLLALTFGGGFGRLGAHPEWWRYVVGGLLGAAVVSVTLVAVRSLGARAMIGCLLTGQLVMAALIDQFGLLGVVQQPLTLVRAFGLAMLAGGVVLVLSG